MSNRLKLLEIIDEYEYYVYHPNLLNPFYLHNENMTFLRRVRFLLDYFRGYKVYYIFSQNRMIGYCMISNGGGYRFRFTDRDDIIIGPAYITESERGQGLIRLLCENILNQYKTNYKNAYCYIRKDNLSSIKAFEKLGFSLVQSAENSRFTREIRLMKNNQGAFYVYVYKNLKCFKIE